MDFAFWGLFLAVLAYESIALWGWWQNRAGDTISERFISLRLLWPPYGRIVADSFLLWLLWHLVIDPTFFNFGASWFDLVVLMAAGLVSWKFLKPRGE